MINTILLTNQRDTLNKSFSTLNIAEISSKRLSIGERRKVAGEVISKTNDTRSFKFIDGNVFLKKSNQIFCLNHIPGNLDIVLPKTKKLLDWVVLWYDQDRTIFNVSYENHSKIKIYGNGARIMGFDEPLVCDVPFMSLRLTFVNEIDGWIIT